MTTTTVTMMLVLTNLPDRDTALRIARTLVEERLAACINLLAPCRSIYRWQGAIEDTEEWPLLIKTATSRFDELAQRLRALHPYDVPEIIALSPAAAAVAYQAWVQIETAVN